MTNIALIHPTVRPKEAVATHKKWMSTANTPNRIKYIFVVDTEDQAEEIRVLKLNANVVVMHKNDVKSCVAATNKGALFACRYYQPEIYFMLNDDFNEPTEAWDTELVRAFPSLTEPHCLHVDEQLRTDDHVAIVIMNGARYKYLGYMLHPDFKSMYCDDWHGWLSRQDGVLVDVRDKIKVKHNHWGAGLRQPDAADVTHSFPQRYIDGQAVFERLKEEYYKSPNNMAR